MEPLKNLCYNNSNYSTGGYGKPISEQRRKEGE